WKDRRSQLPASPNEWGGGDWRVFDLKKKAVLAKPPADFDPIAPIESVATPGEKVPWRVAFTEDAYVWRVTGPGRTDVKLDAEKGLYLPDFCNLPRCYTFLPYSDKTGKSPAYLCV